ncbi:FecR family protein [Neorhodopirellula lusitana]|uniref:FecR family protein n=1 Tax=Neorhodopirellula lusitana TaxID=445327 RepID=A0ABY1Q7L4_9BACT|nr:FecR domain-containing protein [Neorhodopirellula lusitana]SMP59257.1 FecR family protein [Neorhodopirellula lusitana]
MNPLKQSRRVEELLQLCQEGGATADQVNELNDLLRNDIELRLVATRFLQLDSMLEDEFQVRSTATRFDAPSGTQTVPPGNASRVSHAGQERGRWFGRWKVVLAASLIGFALVYSTLLYNKNQTSLQLANDNLRPMRIQPRSEFGNVMTVTYQEGARWERDVKIGDQIDVGHLRLNAGVARLNTVYGAVIILDAREGIVNVEIKPDRSLTVHQGTVFAKAYDQAIGFALRTPTTSVVDIGTEFAVKVAPDGQSDVTVLDGAVTWLPVDRSVILGRSMLAAGRSLKFRSPSDRHGLNMVDPDEHLQELRAFTSRINSPETEDTPLVSESFDYPLGVMHRDEGGHGWTAPWCKNNKAKEAPSGVVRQGGYLVEPAWLKPSSPRYTVVSLASVSAREFAEPIDLSVDQDIFLSAVMRKRVIQVPRDDRCGGGITLRSGTDSKHFELNIDMRERLALFNGETYFGGRTLEPDNTYLLVLKLALRREAPDQLFAKAYTIDSPPAAREPTHWDVVSEPSHQDGFVDQMRLWAGATAIAAFDEIRLGTTWNSVVPIRH